MTVLNNDGGVQMMSDVDSGEMTVAHTTDSVGTMPDGTPYAPIIRGGTTAPARTPGTMSLMEALERERHESRSSKLKGLTLPSRISPVPPVGTTCSTAPVEMPTLARALPKALRPKEPRRPSQTAAFQLPAQGYSTQPVHPLATKVDISDSVLKQRRNSFSTFNRQSSNVGHEVGNNLSRAPPPPPTSQPPSSYASGLRHAPPEVVVSGPDAIKRSAVGMRCIVHEPNPGLAMLRKHTDDEMTDEQKAAEAELEEARRSPSLYRMQSNQESSRLYGTARSSSHVESEPSPGLSMLAKLRDRKKSEADCLKEEEDLESRRSPTLRHLQQQQQYEVRGSVNRASLAEPKSGLAMLRKWSEGERREGDLLSAEEEEARRSPIFRQLQNPQTIARSSRMSLQLEPNPGTTMLRQQRDDAVKPPIDRSRSPMSRSNAEPRGAVGRMSFSDSKSFFSAFTSSDAETSHAVGPATCSSATLTRTSRLKVDRPDDRPTSPAAHGSGFTPTPAKTSKFRMFSYLPDDDDSDRASTASTDLIKSDVSPRILTPPPSEPFPLPAEGRRSQAQDASYSRYHPDYRYRPQSSPGQRRDEVVVESTALRSTSPAWYDPIPASPRIVIRAPRTSSRQSVSDCDSPSFTESHNDRTTPAPVSPHTVRSSTSSSVPKASETASRTETVMSDESNCAGRIAALSVNVSHCGHRDEITAPSVVIDSNDTNESHLDDDEEDACTPPALPAEAPPPIPTSLPPSAAFDDPSFDTDNVPTTNDSMTWTSASSLSPNATEVLSSPSSQGPSQQPQQQVVGWYARLSYHRPTDSNVTTDSGLGRSSELDCFSGHDSSADELDDSSGRSTKDETSSRSLQQPDSLQSAASDAAASARISVDAGRDAGDSNSRNGAEADSLLSPTTSDVPTTDSEFEDNGSKTDCQQSFREISGQPQADFLNQLLAENGATLDTLMPAEENQQTFDDCTNNDCNTENHNQNDRSAATDGHGSSRVVHQQLSERPADVPITTWELANARETPLFQTWADDSSTKKTGRQPLPTQRHDEILENGGASMPAVFADEPKTAPVLNDVVKSSPTTTGSVPAPLGNGGPGTIDLEIIKGSLGLGFCIEGGVGSSAGDRPVVVKRLFRNDIALGGLRAKDEIVAVDGVDFTRLSHYEAWNRLKALPDGIITITVRRRD